MRRFLRIFLMFFGGVLGLVVLAVLVLMLAVFWNASDSDWPRPGEMAAGRSSTQAVESREEAQVAARALAGAESGKQILFGDLHVHTSYSSDAMVQGLPLMQGEGVHPPADACDFARYCSALDFWSINDHAESLTPAEWERTQEVIAQCNRSAGSPDNPDLVSFLGWEWSQGGATPESHFGHKNVVLREYEEGLVPLRPIASDSGGGSLWGWLGLATSLQDVGSWGEYADFHRSFLNGFGREPCPAGVDVRDLPPDCYEVAASPDILFEKLDQWDLPAIVIPHGLAWGVTNPKEMDLSHQLSPAMHDPERQFLIEVYSGHGNSEVFEDFSGSHVDAQTRVVCPEPTESHTACCWRAGEIVRARCADPRSRECEYRVEETRKQAAGIGRFLNPTGAVLGSSIDEFGDCDQLLGSFLPAFNYRPRGSAQYGLALGNFETVGEPQRFRFGFLASSDTHRARPGKGYKEFNRLGMTDGRNLSDDWTDPRRAAFFYTGGLVAVHASARDRGSIFEALERREVYGTSGDRILLWFDLLDEDGGRLPMGTEVRASGTPRFEVRALGAFEQLPGCPAEVEEALTPERLKRLCLGECHHPGERRKKIDRIEVVRIRPQVDAGEPIAPLVEDPWLTLPCGDGDGGEACLVAFEDAEFQPGGRETVYYVRAIEEPSLAVGGGRVRCEQASGEDCDRYRFCPDPGVVGGDPSDCLGPVEERAWSSPIFVLPN